MISPNKVVSLKDSALGKTVFILSQGPEPIAVSALYQRVANNFESIDQFLLTLDLLFVLERIDIEPGTRMITYVD
ncbi:TPA: ABC-three component system middle component 7 [Stenotrophomonas maltophilia]